MADLVIPRCSAPGCGKSLPPRGRRGPAARYCSVACRVAAYRARGAVIAAQFETADDEWDDAEQAAEERGLERGAVAERSRGRRAAPRFGAV